MRSDRIMRVAVVTPYFEEPMDVLAQCHQSVLAQTIPCAHFLVADGVDRPEVRAWVAEHVRLPRAHADNGNTPRAIGSLSAMNQGFDAIAYLDADNWYEPGHVERLLQLCREKNAAVAVATRNIHRIDGSFLATDSKSFERHGLADTSCLLMTRRAFSLLPLWAMMPKHLSPVCDRVFWSAIVNRGFPYARLEQPTVCFRSRYRVHYESLGEVAPPGTRSNEETTGEAYRWWNGLSSEARTMWSSFLGATP
jgi:glycosyltransferase involved in cell wall biosynthesis